MATSKTRINLSVPSDLEEALKFLAKRDNMPVATKATHLIKAAIEIDEDAVWTKMAQERDTSDAKFVSGEEAWA